MQSRIATSSVVTAMSAFRTWQRRCRDLYEALPTGSFGPIALKNSGIAVCLKS